MSKETKRIINNILEKEEILQDLLKLCTRIRKLKLKGEK